MYLGSQSRKNVLIFHHLKEDQNENERKEIESSEKYKLSTTHSGNDSHPVVTALGIVHEVLLECDTISIQKVLDRSNSLLILSTWNDGFERGQVTL